MIAHFPQRPPRRAAAAAPIVKTGDPRLAPRPQAEDILSPLASEGSRVDRGSGLMEQPVLEKT
jgi:hypothetical protein